jgi:hypothetical protein
MTDKQESSSVDINIVDNIERNTDRDNITEIPFVDAMSTPFPLHSIRASVATPKKLKTKKERLKNNKDKSKSFTSTCLLRKHRC